MKILQLIPFVAFLITFSKPIAAGQQEASQNRHHPVAVAKSTGADLISNRKTKRAKTESNASIQRTWMPNAHPGSFAVGFPAGLNYCFDPVEMVVAYAWTGDYVDLEPTIGGKFPRNATLQGKVFYAPSEPPGFVQDSQSGEPERQFKGYRVRNGAPRFHFEVNEMSVNLSLRPTEDGDGLLQRFQIESWRGNLRYRPIDPSHVTVLKGQGKWTDGNLHFPEGTEIEFTELIAR